ncbi:MAG TPA: T9SS type A sorting domain-containing protein, partial [Bacteroidia bacterium]|nr:T9SS type A sorting domain-containing protein [Bacteroidia bacterium]
YKLTQKSSQITYSYACNNSSPREGNLMNDDEDGFTPLSMNVYPNPALSGSDLNMHIASEEATSASLIITDMLGRTVVNKSVALSGYYESDVTVSLDGIKPGYYMVVVSTDEERVSKALIIE